MKAIIFLNFYLKFYFLKIKIKDLFIFSLLVTEIIIFIFFRREIILCYTNSQIPINQQKKKRKRETILQRNEKKNYKNEKSLVFVKSKTSSLVRSYNLLKTDLSTP